MTQEDVQEDSLSDLNVNTDDVIENDLEIHESEDDDCAKFLLSNARSLAPKMTSLIDYMYDLKCDFTMISETWFKGGKKLRDELSDMEQAAGIKFLCKYRPAKSLRGGGVALAFNSARCNLKRKQIKTNYEIVCAVGKVGKIERQFAVFSVYVPPKTRSAEFAELCEDLASALI